MRNIAIDITEKKSLTNAINVLETYKKALHDATKWIVESLLRYGIRMTEVTAGAYAGYILFETEVHDSEYGYVGALIAKDRSKFISRWMRKDGSIVSAEVSPLLMAEFGSGKFAQVEWDSMVGLVGQGKFTYPDQIENHAFDSGGWRWMDTGGNWHHSYGSEPTMPMFKAWKEMMDNVDYVVSGKYKFLFLV